MVTITRHNVKLLDNFGLLVRSEVLSPLLLSATMFKRPYVLPFFTRQTSLTGSIVMGHGCVVKISRGYKASKIQFNKVIPKRVNSAVGSYRPMECGMRRVCYPHTACDGTRTGTGSTLVLSATVSHPRRESANLWLAQGKRNHLSISTGPSITPLLKKWKTGKQPQHGSW